MAAPATRIRRALLSTTACLGVVLLVAACGNKGQKGAASQDESSEQATAGQPPLPSKPAGDEGALSLLSDPHTRVGLSWDVPDGWVDIDEFKASRVETWNPPTDDESIQAFAFSFGPNAGNAIKSNLRRWGVQLRLEDGSPPAPEIESWASNGLKFTVATFTGQSLTGMRKNELALGADGARLVGAIVEGGPEGNVFFRLSGPTGSVEALTPAFMGMVRSVRPLDDAPSP